MVNVTVKMYNFQELIRKTHLKTQGEGLIQSAVIVLKNKRMNIDAIGFEDSQGTVDQTIMSSVTYPCESVEEEGEIAVDNLGDLLSKLELFKRDEIVQIYTNEKNLIITRPIIDGTTSSQTLSYELADKNDIKSYPSGIKIVFDNPIVLKNINGNEKKITFDSFVVVDGQKIKEHGSVISEIKAKSIPLTIKDGKLFTNVKGETSGLDREVEGIISIDGNASSIYDKEFLTILKHAIGVVTLRFSEGSPIHIHFEHESMTADYLLQVNEE